MCIHQHLSLSTYQNAVHVGVFDLLQDEAVAADEWRCSVCSRLHPWKDEHVFCLRESVLGRSLAKHWGEVACRWKHHNDDWNERNSSNQTIWAEWPISRKVVLCIILKFAFSSFTWYSLEKMFSKTPCFPEVKSKQRRGNDWKFFQKKQEEFLYQWISLPFILSSDKFSEVPHRKEILAMWQR